MADIKLFNIKGDVKEYQSGTVTLEKELQTVIEQNMETFFGVTFLATEYRTTDGGRMDSIGIDENHCPVIFEYKRSMKDNVINQGLFYLNWLLDHKDSFKVLVIEKLGLEASDNIDWSMPRVVCIAGDFTKYDESAIKMCIRDSPACSPPGCSRSFWSCAGTTAATPSSAGTRRTLYCWRFHRRS